MIDEQTATDAHHCKTEQGEMTEAEFEDWIERFRLAFKHMADKAKNAATAEERERLNSLLQYSAKESRRSYYKDNKDRILANVKEWQARNKDRVLAYRKSYYDKNRELILERAAARYKENKGERRENPCAKLTGVQVREARALRALSGTTYEKLAKRYGVTSQAIWMAVQGRAHPKGSWRNLY